MMRAAGLILLVLASLLLQSGSGQAQSAQVLSGGTEQDLATVRSLSEEKDRVIADLSQQLQALRGLSEADRTKINNASTRALASYYEGLISVNENSNKLRLHQQAAFAWQLTAANWLLGVVVLVAGCGVLFAGYEMVSARRLIAENAAGAPGTATQAAIAANVLASSGTDAAPSTAPSSGTTITLEPTKIHITSAVIGIVILSLSLGFLFLFLKEVYSINVINLTDRGGLQVISTKENDARKDGDSGKEKEASSP